MKSYKLIVSPEIIRLSTGRILLLAASSFFISCNTTPAEDSVTEIQEVHWRKFAHIYTDNRYNPNGLLDTTYETTYVYTEQEVLLDSSKSCSIRKYDGKRITMEKSFSVESDGTRSQTRETVNRYDENGNLTLTIENKEGRLWSKRLMLYNKSNELIKATRITREQNSDKLIENLDLPIDRGEFDTTIIVYEYDSNGNMVKSSTYDGEGSLQNIVHSKYEKNELIYSIEVGPIGDTLSRFVSEKDGRYTKHIRESIQGGADTTWLDNGKIVKSIRYDRTTNKRSKMVILYNDKGDEVESIDYNEK